MAVTRQQKALAGKKRGRSKTNEPSERPPKHAMMTRRQKRDTYCDAIRNALFGVPELLESILLHLPMKDLLLVQRVCRTFRDTIAGSITIQQNIFFAPKFGKDDWGEKGWHAGKLLLGSEQLEPEEYVSAVTSSGALELAYRTGYYNPLLVKISKQIDPYTWPLEVGRTLELLPASFPYDKKNDASWRRMFLTQPPMPLWLKYDRSEAYVLSEGDTVLNMTPLTMGNVIRRVKANERWRSVNVDRGQGWYNATFTVMDMYGPEEGSARYSLMKHYTWRLEAP